MKTRHIALILSFCGTRYHGWQIQKNATSVAQTLTDAISTAVNEKITLIGCGRTDSGVHATRYVADFFTSGKIAIERLPNALNSLLPLDISVLNAYEMPHSFHSIRSCLKKEYVYKIHENKYRDPFLQDRAFHYSYSIDMQLVNEAAAFFIGTHDFSAMQTSGTTIRNTVRTMFYCKAHKQDDIIYIYMCANGFLYNMARTIAGTLINVSQGKISPTDIPEILSSRDRTRAGVTAPAHGLYLSRLWYNENNEQFNNNCFINNNM